MILSSINIALISKQSEEVLTQIWDQREIKISFWKKFSKGLQDCC